MERRYFERKKGRIEIIPMIDIMLFLLVFFIMITIQMIPDQGLNRKRSLRGVLSLRVLCCQHDGSLGRLEK